MINFDYPLISNYFMWITCFYNSSFSFNGHKFLPPKYKDIKLNNQSLFHRNSNKIKLEDLRKLYYLKTAFAPKCIKYIQISIIFCSPKTWTLNLNKDYTNHKIIHNTRQRTTLQQHHLQYNFAYDNTTQKVYVTRLPPFNINWEKNRFEYIHPPIQALSTILLHI